MSRGPRHVFLLAALAVVAPACVTIYQPLVSLQRPVAVNPQLTNFTGLSMRVRCNVSDMLNKPDAERLCQRVSQLFEVQGAKVSVAEEVEGEDDKAAPPDLFLELSARKLNYENSTLLWMLNFLTLTVFPAITEYTMAQDVVVRDAQGFLLAQETYQARFIRYFGVGFWFVNWTLDRTVRESNEELAGSAKNGQEFSRDMYGQLSQLVFNARSRLVLMRQNEPDQNPVLHVN
jgi:hypothetical protein